MSKHPVPPLPFIKDLKQFVQLARQSVPLMSLMDDPLMRNVFDSQEGLKVLSDLTTLVRKKETEIADCQIQRHLANGVIIKEQILDVLAHGRDGTTYVIEFQKDCSNPEALVERFLTYCASVYARQRLKGQGYEKRKPLYGIIVAEEDIVKQEQLLAEAALSFRHSGQFLNDLDLGHEFSIYFLALDHNDGSVLGQYLEDFTESDPQSIKNPNTQKAVALAKEELEGENMVSQKWFDYFKPAFVDFDQVLKEKEEALNQKNAALLAERKNSKALAEENERLKQIKAQAID